jgi:hypothetical protein
VGFSVYRKDSDMTCTDNLGKFKAKLRHQSLGHREREVELDVQWISSGLFSLEYWRPRDEGIKPHYVMVAEDWYPPDTSMSFTPDQMEKIFELYPSAPKQPRDQCYKPFYEDYELDRYFMDMGHDNLLQVYKDPHEDVDMVYLVKHHFTNGIPTDSTSFLPLYWEDFLRLRDFLNSKRDMLLYSGVKIGPQGVEAVWVTKDKPPHVK